MIVPPKKIRNINNRVAEKEIVSLLDPFQNVIRLTDKRDYPMDHNTCTYMQ